MTARPVKCERLRVPVESAALGAWTIHVPSSARAETRAEVGAPPATAGARFRPGLTAADLSPF